AHRFGHVARPPLLERACRFGDLLRHDRIALFHRIPPAWFATVSPQSKKKPTWWNTLRYSTTSAYSLTSPPARPGCSSSSHPTTSIDIYRSVRLRTPIATILYGPERGKQVDRCSRVPERSCTLMPKAFLLLDDEGHP